VVIKVVLEAALVIALLLAVLAVALAAMLLDGSSTERRQMEHRAHLAEHEIDEIGRRTQEAILAEALRRRAMNGPRG